MKPYAFRSSNERDSRTFKKIPPNPNQKLPHKTPAITKAKQHHRSCNGGGLVGKFGVGQGGLEGRETPPKGVSLRLQGLPHLLYTFRIFAKEPISFFVPTFSKITS